MKWGGWDVCCQLYCSYLDCLRWSPHLEGEGGEWVREGGCVLKVSNTICCFHLGLFKVEPPPLDGTEGELCLAA